MSEAENHIIDNLILAYRPRDWSQRCVRRHCGDEITRVKASESVFAIAAGHHRNVVYVGIVDHCRECGVSVAGGELMPGVLFPELNKISSIHERNYRAGAQMTLG